MRTYKMHLRAPEFELQQTLCGMRIEQKTKAGFNTLPLASTEELHRVTCKVCLNKYYDDESYKQ